MTISARAGAILAMALVAVAVAAAPATAQPRRFREGSIGKPLTTRAPEVLLYTFGVGAVIFEKFGHSALCLDYHDEDLDGRDDFPTVCFNYGVTDFHAGSKLIWGFLREEQKFWVEPVPLRALEHFYIGEDRSIWKQRLPFDERQARAIEDKLWGDLDESRRYYIYDHFYDNCTTRLRDMIDDATGGALKRDSGRRFPMTFREIGRRGLSEFPPLLAITDFMVGRDLDHYPDIWQAMFLPDILRDEVHQRLGAEPEVVYVRQGPPFPTDGPSGRPWMIALAFLFALPLAAARTFGRFQRLALGWAIVPLVLFGLLVWGTILMSPIAGLRWNEAAFLFVPLDLALPFLGEARRRLYARVRVGMIVLVSLLTAIGVLRQPLWVPVLMAFLPMAMLAFDLPSRRAAALVVAPAVVETPRVAAGKPKTAARRRRMAAGKK